MQASSQSISFIVPVYNAEETIAETLKSIVNLNTYHSLEIILVDDGSTDRSVSIITDWLKTFDASEKRIQAQLIQIHHGGEAAAINAGIKKAASPWIAWVESDVVLDREWLNQLLPEIDRPNVAGAGGLLLPAVNDPAIAKMFGYEIAHKIQSNHADALHITSANAIYNKEVFDRLGLCRTELGESSFDSEFNHRVREAGYRLRCNPKALAWHHFKARLNECMTRTWWYGFRRPFVQSQVLYPFDRIIALLVLSSGLLLLALVFFPFAPAASISIGAIILSIHLGYAVFLYCHFSDSILLWSFPIFLLRNSIFFIAYLCGWITKWTVQKTS